MTASAPADAALDLPGGRRLGWREYGDPNGAPLLYCHGTPGSRLEPAVIAEAAARRRLRVVGFDRPGYGQTSPVGSRCLGDEVDDVRHLADALGFDRFDVLGFSGGGPHALAIAAGLANRVGRLSLVSSWASFDAVDLDAMDDGLRALWGLARCDPDACREALDRALADAGDALSLLRGGAPARDRAILDDAATAGAYGDSLREATDGGLAGMVADMAALVGDWRFAPAAVRCPVSVCHGAADGNAPAAMGRWLAARLPAADYTEWPEAAHFEWFGRPDEVLRAHAPG